jgi:hypothetical protein
MLVILGIDQVMVGTFDALVRMDIEARSGLVITVGMELVMDWLTCLLDTARSTMVAEFSTIMEITGSTEAVAVFIAAQHREDIITASLATDPIIIILIEIILAVITPPPTHIVHLELAIITQAVAASQAALLGLASIEVI